MAGANPVHMIYDIYLNAVFIPPVSTPYTQTKGVLLSLDERVDIHTPKIRYMAHRLPIMSHAVGGDENKLRGYIRVFIIKATG